MNSTLDECIEQGKQLIKENRLEQAIAYFRQIAVQQPNSPLPNYYLGDCLEQLGKIDAALDCYTAALKIEPGFYAAREKFLFGELEPYQLDEIVKVYRQIVKEKPESWLYVILGDLLTKQGKLKSAIDAYKIATFKINMWRTPELAQYWNEEAPRKPNFLIIGAMKAGTTSLYEYITKHPQVLACARKEIHFFVHYYEQGLDWYRSHFPPIATNSKFLAGEASPGYLVNRNVAQRVKDSFPETKIIVLLRNPVERAISHYFHNWNLGLERASFEAAIAPEIKTLQQFNAPLQQELKWQARHKGYLYTGVYVYFIKRWLTVFPREQLLIVNSSDFYHHTTATTNQVYKFLNLPAYQLPNYKKHMSGSYSSVSATLIQDLSKLFNSYNQILEDYLGVKLNWN